MCTWIIETAEMYGSGKGADGWFRMNQANVYYDHPYDAPLDHALMIDFVADPTKPGNRVAVEISADSARRLIKSIEVALQTGVEGHAHDLTGAGEVVHVG
jgi:hypothetical protein|tara:strand:+ start:163 stop:462 length:300 start_codon:yes stop_codon:yes gene_type:complete